MWILSGIMDCICLKRKHRKRRDDGKFRPITPQTSPAHSQPSTLGNNGRLPKVNSTGLWLGAPSMYTGAAPSPAYYYGPGKISSQQMPPHPGFISRANSDTRIPSGGGYPYHHSQPIYGSHGNLLLMPIVGMQPRIFHSSQPLSPVFEMPSSAGPGLEIYDVYQFGGDNGNSRSKLVEAKHTQAYYDQALGAYRLSRSQSDVQERHKQVGLRKSRNPNKSDSKPASRTPSEKSKRPPPPPQQQNHRRSASRDNPVSSGSAYSGSRNSRTSQSQDSLDGVSRISNVGHYNQGFEDGLGFVSSSSRDIILMPAQPSSKITIVPAEPIISLSRGHLPNGKTPTSNDASHSNASATDSMKLLAKNKTDDQKTVVVSSPGLILPPSGEENDKNNFSIDDLELSKGHVHYIYQGDIYSVPEKQSNTKNNNENSENTDENPILSRMKEMVIEKSRTNSTKSITNKPNNEESQPKDGELPTQSFSYGMEESIYQEIGSTDLHGDSAETISTTAGDRSVELQNEDVLSSSPDEQTTHSITNPISVTTDNSNDMDNLSIPTSPVQTRPKGDTSFEDISQAGKRITDSAFEFLNTYLSDDDGNEVATDVESPPMSPS